jgi:hypothetical protein
MRKSRNKNRNSHQRSAALVLCAALLLICSGCSDSTHVPRPETQVPDWLIRLPSAPGFLYAIGVTGPTFYGTDGMKWASDHAREELAKSLSARVQSLVVLEQTKKSTSVQMVSATETSAWATDIVLSSSQVVATWVDVNGVYQGGKPRTTYALGMLDFGSVTSEVKARAGVHAIDSSRVGDVRKSSERAFQGLNQR